MSNPYATMTLQELKEKRQEVYGLALQDLERGHIYGARDMRAEAQRIEDEIARRRGESSER